MSAQGWRSKGSSIVVQGSILGVILNREFQVRGVVIVFYVRII